MKAYTVYQPYAYATVAGMKHYETRPRRTNIRGRVAVHAAKGKPRFVTLAVDMALPETMKLHFGAVIGTVEIVDCVPVEEIMHTLTERERLLGDYSPGRFAWVLRNPIMFEKPIPARGKQGWWDWPFVLIETGNKMGSGKSDGSDTRIIWGAGCGPK